MTLNNLLGEDSLFHCQKGGQSLYNFCIYLFLSTLYFVQRIYAQHRKEQKSYK